MVTEQNISIIKFDGIKLLLGQKWGLFACAHLSQGRDT